MVSTHEVVNRQDSIFMELKDHRGSNVQLQTR